MATFLIVIDIIAIIICIHDTGLDWNNRDCVGVTGTPKPQPHAHTHAHTRRQLQ